MLSYDQEAELMTRFRRGDITSDQLQDELNKANNQGRTQNQTLRKARLDKLKQEREAQKKIDEEEFDQTVAPQKRLALNQWLADHPGKTAEDFEKQAWPHLRANLKQQAHDQDQQHLTGQLIGTGQYNF